MRKKILAGNWKMNLEHKEALDLVGELMKRESEFNAETVTLICPPALYLSEIAEKLKQSNHIKLGAQNCHFEKNGAYTGEVSASMLKSIGVEYCLVGHSERRDHFNEDYGILSKKVKALTSNNIIPIFCCGEQLQVRDNNIFKEFILKQIEDSLFGLDASILSKTVIAYEPIWAIGTGKTATSAQAQEMHHLIRQRISGQYNEEVAKNLTILYGGSCKPDNAKELFEQKDIDGGLIGGASLKADDFIAISKSF